MKQLLKVATAPAMALFAFSFVALAAPAPASAYEYCRKDVTSSIVSCSFDTLEQCQATSLGRGGDCFRDPFLPSRDALAYAPKTQGKLHRAPTHAQ
jgi:uncharacterized protein DUF3551